VQVKHAETGEVTQILNFGDTVALQPDGFQIEVVFETLNSSET
jgi:hypothetical protein